jgi:hypothetical protein
MTLWGWWLYFNFGEGGILVLANTTLGQMDHSNHVKRSRRSLMDFNKNKQVADISSQKFNTYDFHYI